MSVLLHSGSCSRISSGQNWLTQPECTFNTVLSRLSYNNIISVSQYSSAVICSFIAQPAIKLKPDRGLMPGSVSPHSSPGG
jgi:hypothetical protein